MDVKSWLQVFGSSLYSWKRKLQPLFSNKERALTPDFEKVDEVRTESAKLLLYKRM